VHSVLIGSSVLTLLVVVFNTQIEYHLRRKQITHTSILSSRSSARTGSPTRYIRVQLSFDLVYSMKHSKAVSTIEIIGTHPKTVQSSDDNIEAQIKVLNDDFKDATHHGLWWTRREFINHGRSGRYVGRTTFGLIDSSGSARCSSQIKNFTMSATLNVYTLTCIQSDSSTESCQASMQSPSLSVPPPPRLIIANRSSMGVTIQYTTVASIPSRYSHSLVFISQH